MLLLLNGAAQVWRVSYGIRYLHRYETRRTDPRARGVVMQETTPADGNHTGESKT